MPRNFLIDTDTASDDAVALLIANHAPGIHIEAITTVAGNVPIEKATQNALYVQDLCAKSIPVYQGAAKPILRPLETAQFFHGHDGLGDVGLPLSGRTPTAGNPIDAIIDAAKKHSGSLELITLGPLTNIAIALLKAPEIAGMIKHCFVMGGVGQGPGNMTTLAEFNFWVDPEAAKIVFESAIPITMIGWDIAWKYTHFNEKDAQSLRNINTDHAHFAVDIQKASMDFVEKNGEERAFNLPDPIAVAIALDPEIITHSIHTNVAILCHDDDSRGMTVVDHINLKPDAKKIEVVLEASREKFLKILEFSLGKTH